jgi:hypothetical protein
MEKFPQVFQFSQTMLVDQSLHGPWNPVFLENPRVLGLQRWRAAAHNRKARKCGKNGDTPWMPETRVKQATNQEELTT